jgi:hypothetical protein
MTKWLALLALPVAACSSNNDSGPAPAVDTGGTTPAAPAVSIVAKGGASRSTSGDYAGGHGGEVTIWNYDGTGIHILKTGAVNAFIEIPDTLPDLGANPRTIDADTTLTPSSGSFFMPPGYLLGDDGMTPATGLWVKPGVTLTLNANVYEEDYYLPWSDSGNGYHAVFLRCDYGAVLVEGAIRVPRKTFVPYNSYDLPYTWDASCDLFVYTGNFVVSSTGSIDLKGAPDSLTDRDSDLGIPERGGNGGHLEVVAEGSIVNKGTIETSGGSGPSGGDAGHVYLFSYGYGVYNSGTIRADGADGSELLGGNGYRDPSEYFNIFDYINYDKPSAKPAGKAGKVLQYGVEEPTILLLAGTVGAVNTGTLTARGGVGYFRGGRGGTVVIGSELVAGKALAGPGIVSYPAVASSGDIDVSGGNSLFGFGAWNTGGAGGSIHIIGEIYRVAGSLVARGGSTTGSTGGRGGEVIIGPNPYGRTKALAASSATANPYGDNAVGAAIDVTGGDSGVFDAFDNNGGPGGYVYIESNLEAPEPCAELYLVNYERIDVSGGDGEIDGGDGGRLWIVNGWNTIEKAALQGPGIDTTVHDGLLENEVAIVARGGNGKLTNGGEAGDVMIENTSVYDNRALVNSGDIDARGGDGGTNGGDGEDSVYLYSNRDLTNTGAIDVSGGAGYYQAGGSGGRLSLQCEAALVNGGSLASNGGLIEYAYGGLGGSGGSISLYAGATGTIASTGPLSAAGGPCNGNTGGNGGEIDLYALSVSTSGSLDATGGDGGADYDGSLGGAGGSISVTSLQPSSTVDGTPDVSGGAGSGSDGVGGSVWIDGIQVTGPDVVVQVVATDASAAEAGPDTGTFTVSRTGSTAQDLIVHIYYTYTDSDFTLNPSNTSEITIPAGSSSVTVTVTPVQDADTVNETVTLNLNSGYTTYVVGAASSASVLITDDDIP